MIIRKTIAELAQFLEVARTQLLWRDPVIEVIGSGQYRVSGTTKPFYEIFIGNTEQGIPYIACGCLASLNKRPCYHALGVMDLWEQQNH